MKKKKKTKFMWGGGKKNECNWDVGLGRREGRGEWIKGRRQRRERREGTRERRVEKGERRERGEGIKESKLGI